MTTPRSTPRVIINQPFPEHVMQPVVDALETTEDKIEQLATQLEHLVLLAEMTATHGPGAYSAGAELTLLGFQLLQRKAAEALEGINTAVLAWNQVNESEGRVNSSN